MIQVSLYSIWVALSIVFRQFFLRFLKSPGRFFAYTATKELTKHMDVIFVLSSVTYAMKGRDLLKAKGIPSLLTRSSAIRKVRGCGYGLQVQEAFRNKAEALLKQNGIAILGTVPLSR